MTLFKWLRQADVDEGSPPGVGRGESVELREARKRIRLLEQENEVLRRAPAYLARANPTWGYRRLRDELPVPGVRVAASTVWETLRQAGIEPAPNGPPAAGRLFGDVEVLLRGPGPGAEDADEERAVGRAC